MNNLFGTILAVDDNRENLQLMEFLFRPFKNIHLEVALSGIEALEKLKKFNYDLILLDIEMPVVDGYETAQRIKEDSSLSRIPIVFITGEYNAQQFIEKGFALGAVDYLNKPIDNNQLLNRVNLYLQLSVKEKELKLHTEHLEKLVDQRTKDLKLAIEATENANRFKNEFYSNMSHELRTPLHAILTLSKRGSSQLDLNDSDKVKFYFKQIRDSGERMLDLVNNLLDLNKYEYNKQQIFYEDINLSFLTKKVLNEFVILFDENKIEYIFNETLPDLIVACDKKQISIVMRNLISNAIKFTNNEKFIQIEMSCDKYFVNWSIRDKGVGVPEDEKELIFEPFRQSSRTKSKAGGTGLGLSISSKIIDAHKGSIQLNCLSNGSQFIFSIPIKQIEA